MRLPDIFLGDLTTKKKAQRHNGHDSKRGVKCSQIDTKQSHGAVRHSARPLLKADLANMLIIEAVPLAVAEGFDAGVVVAARSTPAVNHDGEELKGQQALRKHMGEEIIARTKA